MIRRARVPEGLQRRFSMSADFLKERRKPSPPSAEARRRLRSALISTIPPLSGGVPAMLRVALDLFAEVGIECEVAWYEPWSLSSKLSVPLGRLGTRGIGVERREPKGGRARTWRPAEEAGPS